MSTSRYNQVRQRANFLCEYCHASEKWQYVTFNVDHVIPLSKGGSDSIDNLALACFHCNRQKSNKQLGFADDSITQVYLFNPRTDLWEEHFIRRYFENYWFDTCRTSHNYTTFT